ncbi:MAG: adenylyl-sulfate kinase [Chitinispirillaceae bacterium]|nr:adenylyl-sulfate kinase [Chitinispirillaceae bacterium]
MRSIAERFRRVIDTGVISFTAFISPFIEDRKNAKSSISAERFMEISIATPIEE